LKNALAIATAAAALVVSSSVVHAAEIGKETPCGIVLKAFDRQVSIPEIVTTIRNVMQDLDDRHTNAGEVGALAPLSDQGMPQSSLWRLRTVETIPENSYETPPLKPIWACGLCSKCLAVDNSCLMCCV
jgi:hypothetical protein